jgi:hypothetical protein
MKHTVILIGELQRRTAAEYLAAVPFLPLHEVIIREVKNIRKLVLNDLMWVRLNDIADQVDWYGRKLSAESWKDVITASLRKQDVVPGLDGQSFVVLGQRTSQMTNAEISDVIECATAFGCEKGVVWKEKPYPEEQ